MVSSVFGFAGLARRGAAVAATVVPDVPEDAEQDALATTEVTNCVHVAATKTKSRHAVKHAGEKSAENTLRLFTASVLQRVRPEHFGVADEGPRGPLPRRQRLHPQPAPGCLFIVEEVHPSPCAGRIAVLPRSFRAYLILARAYSLRLSAWLDVEIRSLVRLSVAIVVQIVA